MDFRTHSCWIISFILHCYLLLQLDAFINRRKYNLIFDGRLGGSPFNMTYTHAHTHHQI